MAEEKREGPIYTGMIQYNDPTGISLFLPDDWHKSELQGDHKGVLFSPYPDDINTGILAEKYKLKVKVNQSDLPALREGFMGGIKALAGVEIESESEFIAKTLSFFEVRFTFLEGEIRRKRWIRNIYNGKSNYVLIAQGRTPEDFEYWLPMFYNIMMNASV
jgi:hypothetical protein